MRKLFFLTVLIHFLFIQSVAAQTPISLPISELIKNLNAVSARESTYEILKTTNQIPYTVGDSVLFIYKGEAVNVKWMGDFNGWGYEKDFQNSGTQLPQSDIWILKASFPADARLDYKIVIDGTQYLLDPYNPHQQWSGIGGGSPNSELRMPLWKPEPIAETIQTPEKGNLKSDLLINSKTLGYQIMYSVYLPFGYSSSATYPIAYITDGYEYLHEKMGNVPSTLDKLIGTKKIKPLVAIFIDHREPINRVNNRRMTELAMNEKYLEFFLNELIPEVEKKFSVSKRADDRAIIGTSMGGLTAAYFSFARPDVFGLAGIQSPAFWFKPAIYTVCDNPENPPVKVYLTTGSINDTEVGARKMKAILEKNTCTYQYKEVNQGHSWGNWRDLMDDILIYFFAFN